MAEPSIAEQRTKALARLAIEHGANVAPGQDLVVLADDVQARLETDENATCHVALGNGYSFTVPDLPAGREAPAERGFNTSGGQGHAVLREDVWVL